MDYLKILINTTTLAQEENDLPDFLAERIFRIAEALRNSDILTQDIKILNEQIAQYDTFAQTGYMGMGVDNHILEKSIERIEAKISAKGAAN